LQTPVLQQRGEVLSIDLFGPLPKGDNGETWILVVEDAATRWVELYPLQDATAEVCASCLINNYFLRYGFPRRVISDNGVQFVAAAMQQCMFVLGIKQNLTPLYHPRANPVERKNRDIKTQISILVKNEHTSWPNYLPQIRFALNSAICASTGCTPAYLMFGREMRTPFENQTDLRSILNKENYLPQFTPYLRNFIDKMVVIRDRVEGAQDRYKDITDRKFRTAPQYKVGDLVLVNCTALSNAHKGTTKKFMPKRDGPYCISEQVSPTTFQVSHVDNGTSVGKFHTSYLTPFVAREGQTPLPVQPRRPRGRPPKVQNVNIADAKPHTGRSCSLEGEDVAREVATTTAPPNGDVENCTAPRPRPRPRRASKRPQRLDEYDC
jgi:hypothetical protein